MAYLNVFDTMDEDGDNFTNTEQTDSPVTVEKNATSAPASGISTELTRRFTSATSIVLGKQDVQSIQSMDNLLMPEQLPSETDSKLQK